MARLRSRTATTEKDAVESAKAPVARRRRGQHEGTEEPDTYGLEDDEKSSGRPFRILEKLPCSAEPPRYDVLTHALSVRDSAVLYNSLLASRRTWIKAEMFELYWSKQYMNMKERERMLKEGIDPDDIDQSAAREKMHKLCDGILTGGPHTLPIRLFILKNDEIEQKWQSMQESRKKEKEVRRKREAEEKERRREERKRLQQLKKERKLKEVEHAKKEKTERKRDNDTERDQLRKGRKDTKGPTVLSRMGTNIKGKGLTTTFSKAQQQEIDNQKMIANLNLLAQRDPALNKLMIAVANGQAPPADVERFKVFIERARNMEPPPNWKPRLSSRPVIKLTEESTAEQQETPNQTPDTPVERKASPELSQVDNVSSPPHGSDPNSSFTEASMNDSRGEASEAKSAGSLAPDSSSSKQALEKDPIDAPGNANDLDRPGATASSTDAAAPLKQETIAAPHAAQENTEKPLASNEILPEKAAAVTVKTEEGAAPRQKRKYTKRKKEVEDEDKSMQLTTFQQKYLNGADILFEYLENSNMRFLFPKDAILEQLENEESYLMSWIVVHNKKEIEQFKMKVIKDLNKNKATDDDTAEVDTSALNIYEHPNCPEVLYTPMTITLSNIPKKFTPIILNSVNPAESVHAHMSTILARGRRLTGFNLWYQLDAYDDKDLAESLRCELKEYEQGFKSKRQKKQL
ncbi:AaceriAEL336Wp [[Ashbya] aceris (nom. inval.)]|nr:AaceriAEL336Wp [[Ashbya] aceris (nom. inval.)]